MLEQDMQNLPDPILQVIMVVMVMMMSEHLDRHKLPFSGTYSADEKVPDDANAIPNQFGTGKNQNVDAQGFLPKSISFTPCFFA